MAYEILLPRLGWNMEEGALVEWLKKDGEAVRSGDLVCVIEGDKATMEIESFENGVLRIPEYAPAPGVMVAVGTLLGFVVPEHELATFDPAQYQRTEPSAAAQTDASESIEETTAERVDHDGEPAISPRARRVARELGVDWRGLRGSGRTGRIVERDVRAAVEDGATSAQPFPMDAIRQAIARKMSAAVRQTAPVTLTTEADATDMIKLREKWKKEQSPAPSYQDIVIRLVAMALTEHPAMNATFREDKIERHSTANIGFAVDTDHGLYTPVIRNAATRTIRDIAAESARLIAQTRAGKLTADGMQGGTFTITNLGMYDIDAFTPIVNLPECAILGMGRITAKVVVIDEASATIGVRRMMALSLTFDHRIVDGAPAARFLQRVKQLVEGITGMEKALMVFDRQNR